MKKKFLSLIAASLMLGNTPQICASPELFLSALAAVAGATHLRSVQMKNSATEVQEQDSLTAMFKNNVLPGELQFIPVNRAGAYVPYLAIKTAHANNQWIWQILYLPHGVEMVENHTTILEEPVVTSPRAERYDDYRKRFNQARDALIEQARAIAIQLMQTDKLNATH